MFDNIGRNQEKIGIVIPAANEEKSMEELLRKLLRQIDALKLSANVYVVIDKASKDNTRSILERFAKKHSKIYVIYEPKNRNVVDARIVGFKRAIIDECDFIIEMDCGFSHLPDELYKFVNGYQEGYDCVFGVRNLWSVKYRVPFYRRIYSIGGTILANVLLGTNFSDMTSGYEGFRREVLKKILRQKMLSTDHFFQTEMRYKARNFKYKEVGITYKAPTPRVSMSSIFNSLTSLLILAIERFKQKK